MEEVPDTDAGVARTTLQLLTPSVGYLLGEAVLRKILNPRTLVQGRCTSQASMIAKDLRRNGALFGYVVACMPLDGPGIGTPYQRACVMETAAGIQGRMSRVIVNSEIDICRAQRGITKFLTLPELLKVLMDTGNGHLLSTNERANLEKT